MLRAMRLAVGAAAVLAGGVGLAQTGKQPAKEPPKEPSKTAPTAAADGYFPLAPKTKWTYKVQDQNIDVMVAKVGEKFNGEECTQVDTVVNNKVVASELYTVKPDGVYRVKVKEDKIDPPVKVLQLPVKKDAAWEVNSKVGTQTVKGTFKVKGEDVDVETPAGKFKAVLVEGADLDVAGTKTTVRMWFVKDKGVVKLSYKIENAESVLELTKMEGPPTTN